MGEEGSSLSPPHIPLAPIPPSSPPGLASQATLLPKFQLKTKFHMYIVTAFFYIKFQRHGGGLQTTKITTSTTRQNFVNSRGKVALILSVDVTKD